ncbi:DUF6789 family protein [Halorussus caseinilyticus]|uniref:DUF6789 family protein n=1 Tax=Halorussus caseinilyticus TaxID=3034025 RepID=UPI0023E80758|nr:DUF6789 family protein [Halorussus sp. DT72]
MASETTTAVERPTEQFAWKGGALAGLLAGIVMGAMLTTQMGPVIRVAIPSMYGLEGLAAGWVAHLFHSVVLGVAFAGLATAVGVGESTGRAAAFGVGYGVVLWVVLAAVVMPIWLSAVGSPANPPLPNFDPESLVGHVVYGLVLGVAFPSLRDL